MKIQRIWIAICLIFIISCTNQKNTEQNEIEVLRAQLPILKPNHALIKVLINKKDFYVKEPFFKAEVQLLPQLFKVGFQNEEGSIVEVEAFRNDWFEQKHITFNLANGTLGESGGDQVILMIGKLTDKRALKGEGYILVNGKIDVLELNRHLISIVFEGNLVKLSQASTLENYIPVKGWILVKEPAYSDQSSTELLKKIGTTTPDR